MLLKFLRSHWFVTACLIGCFLSILIVLCGCQAPTGPCSKTAVTIIVTDTTIVDSITANGSKVLGSVNGIKGDTTLQIFVTPADTLRAFHGGQEIGTIISGPDEWWIL
jgi:hypothetical protein